MSANISYKALQDLHQLYLKGKHRILSEPMGKEDTKSIWFELNDSLRQFLKDVLEKDGISGIRMYFLQNPNTQTEIDGELLPVDKLDVDQLSIGLVATKQLQGLSGDSSTTSGTDDFEVPPLNHGTLCPQKCD